MPISYSRSMPFPNHSPCLGARRSSSTNTFNTRHIRGRWLPDRLLLCNSTLILLSRPCISTLKSESTAPYHFSKVPQWLSTSVPLLIYSHFAPPAPTPCGMSRCCSRFCPITMHASSFLQLKRFFVFPPRLTRFCHAIHNLLGFRG